MEVEQSDLAKFDSVEKTKSFKFILGTIGSSQQVLSKTTLFRFYGLYIKNNLHEGFREPRSVPLFLLLQFKKKN